MDRKQIDPDHAEIFKQMFGEESQGDGVDIMDPKLKEQIKNMSSPLPLKICESFFNFLTYIFTRIMPIALISITIFSLVISGYTHLDSIRDTYITVFSVVIPKIFNIVVVVASIWIILQVINYLIQFIIVKVYDIKLKKLIKEYNVLETQIKKNLKKKDTEEEKRDQEQHERSEYGGYTRDEIIAQAKTAVENEDKKRAEQNNSSNNN